MSEHRYILVLSAGLPTRGEVPAGPTRLHVVVCAQCAALVVAEHGEQHADTHRPATEGRQR